MQSRARSRRDTAQSSGAEQRVGFGLAPELESILENVRQSYLDALPIAAAIVTVDGKNGPFIECANDHFRLIAEWDERLGDRQTSQVPILAAGPIAIRLAAFLRGSESAHQFDTPDGRSVAGRHFIVRFSRLKTFEGQPKRFLLSLIDKTAQVETEKACARRCCATA